MAVFHWQRPTRFDKCGNLTIVSTLKMHTVGHHFHAGNCRGCSQTLWPCRENKNRKKVFFLVCSLVIRENLCLRKFPAIRYHFEQNNWSTYSFSFSHYSNKCHSTSSLITLSFWSKPKDLGMCDQTLSLMRLRLVTLSLVYTSFFSFSVAKTWVSYIICAYHVCLHISELCFMPVYIV